MQIHESNFKILKQSLDDLNQIELVIDGISMEPLIKNNSTVIIHKFSNPELLKRFDIIVLRLNGVLVCHYFWRKNIFSDSSDYSIITRPLNPISGQDPPSKMSDVLGQVSNYHFPFSLKIKILFLFLWKKKIL